MSFLKSNTPMVGVAQSDHPPRGDQIVFSSEPGKREVNIPLKNGFFAGASAALFAVIIILIALG